MENLAEKDCKKKTCVDIILDSVNLVQRANFDINMLHRTQVFRAPRVNKKYVRLTSEKVPVTSLLFGDELSEACKDIKWKIQTFLTDGKKRYDVQIPFGLSEPKLSQPKSGVQLSKGTQMRKRIKAIPPETL